MNLTNLTLKRPFKTYHFASASSVVLFTEHKYQELWKKRKPAKVASLKLIMIFAECICFCISLMYLFIETRAAADGTAWHANDRRLVAKVEPAQTTYLFKINH